LGLFLVSGVGGHSHSPAGKVALNSRGIHSLSDRVYIFQLPAADHHIGPSLNITPGNGLANTARGPGDDSYFPGQVERLVVYGFSPQLF
jgi:hypothetical protein